MKRTLVRSVYLSPKLYCGIKLQDELRKKLEVKAFEEGELYFKIQEYQAAITVFDNLLKEFPETAEAGCVIVGLTVPVHPFASVIVTE